MWHKIEYMWMCVCVCMHTNILIYVSIFGRGSIAEWLRVWVFRISEMDFNSNSVCLCSSNLMPLIFPILKLICNFSIQSSGFHFCSPTGHTVLLFVPLHPLTFFHLPNSWWRSSAPPDSCLFFLSRVSCFPFFLLSPDPFCSSHTCTQKWNEISVFESCLAYFP